MLFYKLIKYWNRINLFIEFLLAVTASIDYSDSASEEEEVFKVLVTVADIEGNCGEEVTITVADKSETYELCEGDERPSEEQSADPIVFQEYQFEFPKGEIAVGESFDVCVESSVSFPDVRLWQIRNQSSQRKWPLALTKFSLYFILRHLPINTPPFYKAHAIL